MGTQCSQPVPRDCNDQQDGRVAGADAGQRACQVQGDPRARGTGRRGDHAQQAAQGADQALAPQRGVGVARQPVLQFQLLVENKDVEAVHQGHQQRQGGESGSLQVQDAEPREVLPVR